MFGHKGFLLLVKKVYISQCWFLKGFQHWKIMSLLLQLPWPTLPPSWPTWNHSEIYQTPIFSWFIPSFVASERPKIDLKYDFPFFNLFDEMAKWEQKSHLFGLFATIWYWGMVLSEATLRNPFSTWQSTWCWCWCWCWWWWWWRWWSAIKMRSRTQCPK